MRSPESVAVPRPLLVVAVVIAGVFCLQAAWIFAIQPFRGLDEWDHVYRAGSVANGYWLVEDAPRGRTHGFLIPTPRHLVDAATPICEQYPYVSADNCKPVRDVGDGLVTVSSGAARYHPAFYAIIGIPTSALEGTAALYAMRLLAALLCSAFLGLAVYALALWARSIWPLLALFLCLTPTTLHAMSLPAPNGIEMTSALCVWATLLGMVKCSDVDVRRLLIIASAGVVPLATVRALGPLWLAVILTSALMLLPRGRLAHIWHQARPQTLLFLVANVFSALLAVVWTLVARTSHGTPPAVRGSQVSFSDLFGQVVVWVFQSVGAFPGRDQPAPLLVYALLFALAGLMVVSALVRASAAMRRSAMIVVVAALVVSVGVTLVTYPTAAFIWQGRYALPVTYGVMMIAGFALDQTDFAPPFPAALLTLAFSALATAHAVSVVAALRTLEAVDVPGGDPHWVSLPSSALSMLCILGTAMWLIVAVRLRSALAVPESQSASVS